jgi:hypothetical protein
MVFSPYNKININEAFISQGNDDSLHIIRWENFNGKRVSKNLQFLHHEDLKISLVYNSGKMEEYSYQRGMPYLQGANYSIKLNTDTHGRLEEYIKQFDDRLRGALIPWEEVDVLLPRFSKFTITDINTGLSFNVQRRAGENHSDCQPLTLEDTMIMKSIFNNRWSWEKRAVVVTLDNLKIAGAIHGMPHGSGKISDNGFPGHFCLYFYGSKGHAYPHMDREYHDHILRAAGVKLEKEIKSLPNFLKEKW